MKAFDYVRPASLGEACAALSSLPTTDGPVKALAGGTDVVVQMRHGGLQPSALVSLRDVPGLRFIRIEDDGTLVIGAATPLISVETSPVVRETFPAIAEAASFIGSVQVRTRATIGGNLCNAAPSADMAPILLVSEAEAVITDGVGERRVSLEQFFTGPGETVLARGELLAAISVPPLSAGRYAKYFKSFRSAMDCCTVGVGVVAGFAPGTKVVEDVRIALGAVAPTPMRARDCETTVAGAELDEACIARACTVAVGEARPISDVRATADYRRTLIEVLTRRALRSARSWVEKGATT
jgi:CO/xanthine dehydrogenase FAD-binding subunit